MEEFSGDIPVDTLTINDNAVHWITGKEESDVRIEVSRQPVGVYGNPEVWVRVLSTEVVDWPTVASKLDPATLVDLQGKSMAYYPGHPDKDEQDTHGWLVEDIWVWSE